MDVQSFVYRYAFPSHLESLELSTFVRLAAFSPRPTPGEEAPLFSGRLLAPQAFCRTLLALSDVVSWNELAGYTSLSLRDPVVTANDGILRFEGFSATCSMHVRLDVATDAFDTPRLGRGTTNVDLNQTMCTALGRVRDRHETHLSVGREHLTLRTAGHEIVEHKVELPTKWLRGFCELLVEPTPKKNSTQLSVASWSLEKDDYDHQSGWQNAWTTTIWPSNHEHGFVMAVRSMSARLNRPVSEDAPNAELLEPLLDPSQPWSALAHLAIATALAGKDADASAVAAQALADAFADTRAHPQLLAEALAPFVQSGLFKCNRLAPHLIAIARRSPAQSLLVAETIDALLVASTSLPADAAPLLELWLTQLLELSRAPSVAALARAQSIPGPKACKLVARLATLRATPSAVLAELQAARARLLARWTG